MRRVNWNDGEGLLDEDLSLAGKLADRALARYVIAPIIRPVVADVGNGYPLNMLGANITLSGTENRTVNLSASRWCQQVTPATEDDPDVEIGYAAASAPVLDVRTSGAVWRRDIIQAKIDTAVPAEAENRTVEDAATRQLSTLSVNKRFRQTATLVVKKGADQVSEAAADSNEPVADAGYQKIWSILIPNAGNVDATKLRDYRFNWRRFQVTAAATKGQANDENDVFSSSGGVVAITGAAGAVFWYIPFDLPIGGKLKTARARVRDNATGPTIVRARLFRSVDGTATQIGAAASSGGSGSYQDLVVPFLDETIQYGASYYFLIDQTSGSAQIFVQSGTAEGWP